MLGVCRFFEQACGVHARSVESVENILQKNNINGFQKILIRPPFVFMTAYIRACMDSTSFVFFLIIPVENCQIVVG